MSEVQPHRGWLRRNLIVLIPLVIVAVGYPAAWLSCVSTSRDANYVSYQYRVPFTQTILGESEYFLNEDIANYASFNNSEDAASWQANWPRVDYFMRYSAFGSTFIPVERAHQWLCGIRTCRPTRYITRQEMKDLDRKL